MSKKLNTENFVKKAILIHGDKYDYSKTEYIGMLNKIIIICPKHGEFKQRPSDHISGSGCPKCFGKNSTKDDFIKKAKEIHGDEYDYSNVVYKNTKTPIEITCLIHGNFTQLPYVHLRGNGCKKCGLIKNKKSKTHSKEEFIKKAKKIHGDIYDYSNANYINSQVKIEIKCSKHGEFIISPYYHLEGGGCPKCSNNYMDTECFIQKSEIFHNNKYDYSKVEYVNSKTKVIIICPIHGEFKQLPNSHLRVSGCPKCSTSKGEKKISFLLNNNTILYKSEYNFENCLNKNKRKLFFDFFLLEYNVCIEFHGNQHFCFVPFFYSKKSFKNQTERDKIKEEYCNNNNIPLIIIFENTIHSKKYNFIDLYNNSPKKIIDILKKENINQFSKEEYEKFKIKMAEKN